MKNQKIFEDNIDRQPNGCWLWTGVKDRDGYGIYKGHRAHRYAAAQAGLDIANKVVCHRCDTPGCVNADHLWAGTQQDNLTDMVNKRRHYHSRPRTKGVYKLTPEQTKEIESSIESATALAKKFGVHRSTIFNQKRLIKQGLALHQVAKYTC